MTIAWPSRRKACPSGGGSPISSSTRSARRWRNSSAVRYHSRSQWVWLTRWNSKTRGPGIRDQGPGNETAAAKGSPRPSYNSSRTLRDRSPARQQTVDDDDQRDHQQDVDESTADMERDEAERPQDDQ